MTGADATATAPLLTVALCTWNRADHLRRALASHAAQRVPQDLRWEMIVVDNGSTDDTAAVIDTFADRLPIRHIHERRLGLSNARNAAVDAARGRYILWTDDDVFVPANWLAGYATAIRRWPDAAVLGGPVLPHFEPDPPAWLVDALPHVGNALALLDYGPTPFALAADRLPYGANFAVRTAEQRSHPYLPWLGRSGTQLAGGEEWQVVAAVLAGGETGWWVPWVPVRHLIPAERQTMAYLRRFYVDGTRAAASVYKLAPGEVTLFGRPRWVWRQAAEQTLLYGLTRYTAGAERWSRHFRQSCEAWGMLAAPVPRRAAVRERRQRPIRGRTDEPPVAVHGAAPPDRAALDGASW